MTVTVRTLFPHRPLLIISLGILAACASAPISDNTRPEQTVTDTSMPVTVGELDVILQQAAQTDGPEAQILLMEAAADALDEGDSEVAAQLLEAVDTRPLSGQLQARQLLLQARLALARNDTAMAAQLLEQQQDVSQLTTDTRIAFMRGRADLYLALNQYLAAARELTRVAPMLPASEQGENIDSIWQILSAAPEESLNAQRNIIDSYELRGWIDLVTVVNAREDNIEEQVEAVNRWQARWTQHRAAGRLPESLAYTVQLIRDKPQRIALMVPLAEAAGQAVAEGFLAAYYEAVAQQQQVPDVTVIDTSGVVDVLPLYQQAIEANVDLVVGPLRKESVRQLQQQASLDIPTLALNYGDEGVINPAGFYQFGLAPEDEIRQIARLAAMAGHQSAALLTPAGSEYQRFREFFTLQWQQQNGRVTSSATYVGPGSYSDAVRQLLNIGASEARAERLLSVLPRQDMEFIPRRRQDTDFIFLQGNPSEGRQLKSTLGFHFAGDLPVFAMPSIFNGEFNAVANRDLNDVIFIDAPWMLGTADPAHRQAQQTWPGAPAAVQRLRAMGVDAFRLHARTGQLANFPETRIQGVTGMLHMRADGSIARDLVVAQFDDNVPQIIPAEQLME